MEHCFYQSCKVCILIIGEMAYDTTFVNEARTLCDTLHVTVLPHEIPQMVREKRVDLIFGSLSASNEALYVPMLQEVKRAFPLIKMLLFLQSEELRLLDDILALRCDRYLSMKKERLNALFHLKASIETFTHDIYLAERHYFQTLLDFSIVSQTDVEGNITYVNDNFLKVTGYKAEELLGRNHRMIKHANTPSSVFEEMWQTITQGRVWRGQIVNRNKDGSDFWAETMIIPFKEKESQKILQYLSIRHDLTPFLEKERLSNEIKQKALEQEHLSEAKDAFLVLFTHELKTPLNAILNFAQYLHKHMPNIDEVPREKRLYLLEQIYKSASSMLDNVTNILDLGKLRHDKLHYNLTLFHPKEAILDVIEKHNALALEHKKRIVFKHDGQDAYLTSDEYRFKQILSNILSNAIKYGTSIVEIFLLVTKESIEIVIQDDGKGIKDKKEVFELYNKSSAAQSSREKKGTGIGLHFVKLLCEGLNFEYVLEDSLSLGGTRFTLRKRLKEWKNG
ncbi:PAS domain-containing sensor histidine kinase [Sulfurospirillum deleyianum]|uniref:histidine kinase n=1 Tax=Sulfurospirillum deleyianum (strain ATCC 51133 / DSM 6946 / 5175) TaxID=525898 RepID=D1B4H9_SULD5|nr:PAS domain-containing sensor histidine kinase [Sulfurospirillum deleyianum]ACZ12999.1 PAS sensor protein [Sulfurospirillum deleyianum DSM 6946]